MKNKKDELIKLLANISGKVMCWNCPLSQEREGCKNGYSIPESCADEILAWARIKAGFKK